MTLSQLRRHFPHTDETVYLNHAATGPFSRDVVEAIEAYVEQRHRTHIENYFDFLPVVEETKRRLGALVGADAGRVEFALNTSAGLNVLVQGLDWQPGDRVALPACEFPANVYPFMNLRHRGVEVDFIRHREATFSLEDVERALTPRTRVLSVSWVQFLSGFRADLEALGSLCRAHDALLCVDAIQGLGALQLDVSETPVDFLACGGHKWLMAAQGIGFIYVSERVQHRLQPAAGWLHGPIDWDNFFAYELTFHPDAERFRLGTLNSIGIASLHAALGLYAAAGPNWCQEQVLARARYLRDGLKALGLQPYGTTEERHASGIVTVRHDDPEGVYEHLKQADIVASVRNRLLRFAPSYYNSPDEIERTLDAIAAYGKTTSATA